jgi:hypothetical protein
MDQKNKQQHVTEDITRKQLCSMMGTMMAHVAPITTNASVKTWMKLCNKKVMAACKAGLVRTVTQQCDTSGAHHHECQREDLDEALQQTVDSSMQWSFGYSS